jgi:hypothetical protein
MLYTAEDGTYFKDPGIVFIFHSIKYFFNSFNLVILFQSIFSIVCFIFISSKVKSVNLIYFSLFYIVFLHLEIQWSTLRQCLSFWIVSAIISARSSYLKASIVGFMFHSSSLLYLITEYIKLKRFFNFYIVISFLIPIAIIFNYVSNYLMLPSEILISFFIGSEIRFISSIILIYIFYLLFFRDLLKNNPLYNRFYLALFIIGLATPIGWRLIALALPTTIFLKIKPSPVKFCLFIIILLGLCYFKYDNHFDATLNYHTRPEYNLLLEILNE